MKRILIFIFCLSFFLAKSQHCIPVNLSHSQYPGFSIEYKDSKVYQRVGFSIDVERRIYDSSGRILYIVTLNVINQKDRRDTIVDMIKLFKYKKNRISVMEYYSDDTSANSKIFDLYYLYNGKGMLVKQEVIHRARQTHNQNYSAKYYWKGKNLSKAELYVKTKANIDSLQESLEFTKYDTNPNYEKLYENYYLIGNFKCFSNNNYTETIIKMDGKEWTNKVNYIYNEKGYPVKEIGEGYEIDIEYKCE